MTHAVRVRGAGVVCALGVGAVAVRESVAAGRSGFRTPSPTSPAYPAPFEAARDVPRGLGRRLGRQLAMSLAASLDAVGAERAWFEDPSDTGVVASSAHGPIDETVGFIESAAKGGAKYASPLLFSGAQHSSMVGVVARELGLRGPAMVTSNGEASFETALLLAVTGLAAGRMRRAVVVGADAFHVRYAQSLDRFGLVSRGDAPLGPGLEGGGRGQHLGEGAGALLLEWAPIEPDGVYVVDVALGASALRPGIVADRVEVLASGDAAGARRHAAALPPLDAPVSYPATRFGAFGSLSAVAIAAEAALRLASAPDRRRTLFVSAPRDSAPASVVVCGGDGI